MKKYLVCLGAFACGVASAQSQPSFPPGAPVPTASEISTFVKDKTFSGTRSDGISGKFNYRGDGKFEVIYPQFKEFGTWRTEDGQLCVDDPINGKTCNQVRISNGSLLYRRNKNGEVLTLKE